jgi:hypothetical protein
MLKFSQTLMIIFYAIEICSNSSHISIDPLYKYNLLDDF